MKRRAVGIGFAITVLAALLLILPSAAGESLPATAVGKAASQFDSDRDARIDLPAELHTAAWRRGIGHG